MEFNEYKAKFTGEALLVGFDEPKIQLCLNYAEKLLNNGLPIIFNSTHLCSLVGYNKKYINRAVLSTTKFYREFRIDKKSGIGYRVIKEPLPSLKEIQYWILNNILKELETSKFSKAYVEGNGLINNVRYHKGKNWVFTVDLKDFFPSIKDQLIYDLFIEIGYDTTVSRYLTSLCTLESSLPQGAPTSPMLSNLILKKFDNHIGSYCKMNGINYTRYADDLSFSSMKIENSDTIVTALKNEIIKTLPPGLEINERKTRFSKIGKRQIVTGVVVNVKTQLPIEKRKKIRQEIFFIKKYGLDEHLKKIDSTKKDYVSYLLGKICFGLYLNPNDGELNKYKEYLIMEFKSLI